MTNLPALAKTQKSLQYITFNVGDELYGVDIQCVEEILLPPKVTIVPRTPDYFMGIANLRGEVISIIDLRSRFALGKQSFESARVIVILSRGMKLGMLVDRVSAILTMDSGQFRKAPPLLSGETRKYIKGSYKLDEDSIILMLNHEEIISDEAFLIQQEKAKVEGGDEIQEEVITFKEVHLVGFSIGLEYYALQSSIVEEIIESPKVTPVPEMDTFLKGVFYLRSQAIPLIRLSDLLAVDNTTDEIDLPVIIVTVNGHKIGLMVDRITEVFHVLENQVVPPPTNLNKNQIEQLKGIIKLERDQKTRVVMVLNQDQFLSREEEEMIRKLDAEFSTDEMLFEEEAKEMEVPILEFMIGDERYAVQLQETNEIISMREIVPVPKSPLFIKGVINLRGNVISIVDLPNLINGESHVETSESKILIVQPRQEVAGLIVDSLLGIRKVKLSEFSEPSDLVQQKKNIFIQGIGKNNETDEIIILVDLQTTLNQAQGLDDLNLDDLPKGLFWNDTEGRDPSELFSY